ncbi:MAG TPA: hypothetical protein VMH01_01600 [Puia sp.]|nr:hypothetical protein [Puia sp.]
MENLTTIEPKLLFSPSEINNQLERIFLDPHFSESEILKRFLLFIVHETLEGRSNQLKEYTIAINVLEKPAGFKPWENGIVRIHAGRLRRALNMYYREMGCNDPIFITIPKGKYIPIFTDQEHSLFEAGYDGLTDNFKENLLTVNEDNITLAILPFICPIKNEPSRSFAEGLCLQMTSTLMEFDQISVIAYHAIKNLVKKIPDYKELATSVGFNHILTGAAQYLKDRIRVNIQVIECQSYKQIWSEIYERRLSKSNLFDVQDEICRLASSKIGELGHRKSPVKKALPMLSAI